MGKSKRAFLIVGTLLLMLIGGKVFIALNSPQDDRKQIQEALADSIKASKEGRAGGVLDKLSANIKYNDQDVAGASRDIARYIRDNKPDIEVQNTDPDVKGDEASIVSPVTLKMSLLGQSMSRELKEVTLIFRKEPDRAFLIFPTTRWKLAEVRVPDTSVSSLIQ
jgi:hypothetical protein